jgi:hypothetical protein
MRPPQFIGGSIWESSQQQRLDISVPCTVDYGFVRENRIAIERRRNQQCEGNTNSAIHTFGLAIRGLWRYTTVIFRTDGTAIAGCRPLMRRLSRFFSSALQFG